MVPLTRLNGGTLHLNADLIASVEEFHDTVVTLVDGRCVVVHETAEQVVAEVVRFRANVLALADRFHRDDEQPAGRGTLLRAVDADECRVVALKLVSEEG